MNFLTNKDKVGSCFILLFSLVYLTAIFEIPVNQSLSYDVVNARTLPFCLALLAIVVSAVTLFSSASDSEEETLLQAVEGFQWRPCLLLVGAMFVYAMLFDYLGFLLATSVFLYSGFYILKETRQLFSITVAVGVALFMWLVLTQVFGIYLDSGELYRLIVRS